jgi:hypoxanthine phosphoribosyltransferase
VRAEEEIILFSESAIARRVEELADRIAAAQSSPEIAVPILLGGFVFAADLLRALAIRELALRVEFIRLASYNDEGVASGEVAIRIGPSDAVKNKAVLLIDGVLDSGATLVSASEILRDAGACSIMTAVAVAKKHPGRSIEADYVGFEAGPDFLYGYGMDRAGFGRGLPDIRIARGVRSRPRG